MKNKVKVVLIAGLTNGQLVYDYFKKNKFVDLCLTITYKDEFVEKPRHVIFNNDEKIIKTDFANNHITEIKSLNPDFIFVVGWSELLNLELINIPSKGTIGFHPSILPMDRGRSVIAWQIEEDYKLSGVTMFYYSEIADAGDIIAIERYKIEQTDYVEHVLNKCDSAIYSLIRAYFPLLRKGIQLRKKQILNDGNFRRLRTDYDSVINWELTSREIYNKIRAISKPYPGAFFIENDRKIKIWSSIILDDFGFGKELAPGSKVCELFDKSMIYKTRDGFLRITSWEIV
jgi:methionyl-tRNA formyltransferase